MLGWKDLINMHTPVAVALLTVLAIIFLFWNITLTFCLRRVKKNQKILFSGKKAQDLEKIILTQAKNLKILDKDIQELYSISNQINSLAYRGIHKVGMVRFNPFKDVGGDQSFSIALLNGRNDGLVISSLYTREGSNIYSKAIVSGESKKHPLTEEEKQAIQKATKVKSKK